MLQYVPRYAEALAEQKECKAHLVTEADENELEARPDDLPEDVLGNHPKIVADNPFKSGPDLILSDA